jgi:hypothetical protein
MLFYCLAYSSTLKMVAIWSFKTPIDFQRITWNYMSEDRTLQRTSNPIFTKHFNPCHYIYNIYTVTKISTLNVRYISDCGRAGKRIPNTFYSLIKIIPRLEKTETYSPFISDYGLYSLYLHTHYSKECCNKFLHLIKTFHTNVHDIEHT